MVAKVLKLDSAVKDNDSQILDLQQRVTDSLRQLEGSQNQIKTLESNHTWNEKTLAHFCCHNDVQRIVSNVL